MNGSRYIIVVAALIIVMPSLLPGQRGPSTPEERARALKLIHRLETDPFADDAHEARVWLIRWGAEVPDITVKACPEVIKPLVALNDVNGAILTFQCVFAGMGYIIEHPDSAADLVAVSVAGVEGMLRTYGVMVMAKGMKQDEALETMLAQQKRGELPAIVARQVANCAEK